MTMSTTSSENFHFMLKYIIIGDSGVGKSNILLRFLQNKFFDDYFATVGVEFGAKTIQLNDKLYRLQIWDTAGQENYRSITTLFFKNCACAVVVYDVTRRDTFLNVKKWIEDCTTYSPRTVSIVLVGNKSDLDEKRQVSVEEGIEYAHEHDISFLEASAKSGLNIEAIFQTSVKEIAKRIDEGVIDVENEDCGVKLGKYDPHKGVTLDQKDEKGSDTKCYC